MSLLEVHDLVVQYHSDGQLVHAVNGISLNVESGETLGLVGETGAGKTTTALSILRLVQEPAGKITNGEILFDGENIMDMPIQKLRKIRGNQISIIFQDPMTALNPEFTVGEQIEEVIHEHRKCSAEEAAANALEMLEMVGIPAERHSEYPHQFSGGMKQRVLIAIALACKPKLLIADEPTTALDVTIQAQVLNMMNDLKKQLNTAMFLITHDLGVVAHTCDKVAVMYAGEIVESGTLEQIFKSTAHPYTLGLFSSIPSLDKKVKRLSPIEGLTPDPTNLPAGCKFHPRCRYATEKCACEVPPVTELSSEHLVRCHYAGRL